jgi:hypothetical protein
VQLQEPAAPRRTRGDARHVYFAFSRAVPRKRAKANNDFRKALYSLIPPTVPRFYWHVIELFNERAKYATIRKWCQGTRTPPQWAIDLLIESLEQRANEMLQAIAELKKEKGR